MSDDAIFFDHFSHLCKAVVNPTRMQIIQQLGQQTLSVSELQSRMEISMSNLSNHLHLLFQAGVVNKRKQGSFIYYSLTDPTLLDVIGRMRQVVRSMLITKNRALIEGLSAPDHPPQKESKS